jgi:glycosyltransferase involved in cell wall biosynthesis
MKISVAIITWNEEKNIARCIQSVLPVADEIVVIDSFSTDNTEKICKELGVQFFQQKFLGHIEQKNSAIAATHFDWVLSLDADEELSEQLLHSILQLKKEKTEIVAFSMNRLTNYCGAWIKHTDWYPDKKIRLFHKKYAKWAGINPHDEIKVAEERAVAHLKGDLLHYSYHSIKQHIQQFNHFTEIAAQEYIKSGKKLPVYKIFVNPIWKFIYSYFLRLGFLDGYYGFLVCAISAFATFTKYIKIKELKKEKYTTT